MKLLSILIPTTPDRSEYFDRLYKELIRQVEELAPETRTQIEICKLITEHSSTNPNDLSLTTGAKRNDLVGMSQGKYFAFFDSDDMPGSTYVKRGIEVANSGMDCGELWGSIYFNGVKGMPFHHYLDCTHAWQDDTQYHRPPNHLNFWNKEKVKDFKFEEKTFGEDMTWAMEIKNSGVIKTMYEIPEVIYHYYVGEPKREIV